MKKILKYEIEIIDSQVINIRATELLSVLEQGNRVMIYALTDEDMPEVGFRLFVVGTGHNLPNVITTRKFLGSVKLYDGGVIFHVFYGREGVKHEGV